MGRRAGLRLLGLGLLALCAVSACDRSGEVPEDTELTQALGAADRLWDEYGRQPSPELYRAFREASLAVARRHTEPHDAIGVKLQVRLLQAQATEAARMAGADERAQMAFEVIDAIDAIEKRDLFRIWEESYPGASEALRSARDAARKLIP